MTTNFPPEAPWEKAGQLRSALASRSAHHSVGSFITWFEKRRAANRFAVDPIPFGSLSEWHFTGEPSRLVHDTGKFFSIEGLRVRCSYGPVGEWDQPIINQPEIGILGILVKPINGIYHLLLQAKMEPGNVNTLQLSPTVQATRSNYTRTHKGSLPRYLEYFGENARSRIVIDQLQPEQGARFLRKQNRNMVVEVLDDVPAHEDYCWLTLGLVKQLLKLDNLVNMDTRTVLSCMDICSTDAPGEALRIAGDRGSSEEDRFARSVLLSLAGVDRAEHRLDHIVDWVADQKSSHELSVERICLNELRRWERTEYEIRHETGSYFSVIAVRVRASNREVGDWSQPLLKHTGYGLLGFLTQERHSALHFLVRAGVEPGNRDLLELAPTVACSAPEERLKGATAPAFLERFVNPHPQGLRYTAVQSEEGGRFLHFQNRYVIIEVPSEEMLDLPSGFIWMTLDQIYTLMSQGLFSIDARNLLACLPVA
jgi:oxidase EvaA